ncbi:4734_t:CDS:1 [Diversispora eburnea]|uniref:4734_t:CDS:1 n=1 Tax=Diversispora eburnea TaxID=1213867 RepID=A0A9N8YLY4_9GLOM|nr:4734_t:CDS:1 [Diversispora eburnea]
MIEKWRGYMKEQNTKSKLKKTKFDLFVIYLLIGITLTQLYYAFWSPPPNMFRPLKRMPKRNYINSLREGLLRTKEELSSKEEILLDKFQSLENRLVYATYGEEALMECTYCKDISDYFYFIIPTIIWSYITMWVVLGISTMSNNKANMRTYGTIFLVGCGIFELYTLSTADIQNNKTTGTSEFLYCTTDFYRRLAFSILCLGILLYGKAEERSAMETIYGIIRNQELIIQRNKAINIQRTAVLRDENLRKIFEDFYKTRETEDNLDPGYKEARDNYLSENGIDKLAELYVNDITKMKDLENETGFASEIRNTGESSGSSSQ